MAQRRRTTSGSKKPRGRSAVVNDIIEERRRPRNKSSDVKIWDERLDFAIREAVSYQEDFAENLAFYIGNQVPGFDEKTQTMLKQYTMTVNRVLPAIASTNSQIMPRTPWYRLSARRPLGANGEDQLFGAEMTLNYVLRSFKQNYLTHARLALISGEMAIGFLKVVYSPDEGVDPEMERDEETGELEISYDDQGNEIYDITGGVPAIDPETGKLIKRGANSYLLDNRNPADYYKVDWIDWRDMVCDPEGGNDMNDHAWIAQRVSWPVEDFIANPMFEKADKDEILYISQNIMGPRYKERRLKRQESNPARMYGREYGPEEKDLLRIWGYQIWDIKKREVNYYVDGMQKLAGKYAYPGWIDVSPYSALKFHEVPGEWYPYPEISPSRSLSKAYNLFWSMLLNHIRRFSRKYAVAKGTFVNPAEREKLKDSEDGSVVEVTNPQGIQPIIDAPLDTAIYQMMNQAVSDMSEILGSAPEARGIAQSGSATQAALIDRRGTSRENDKRMIFGTFLRHNAKILLDCLQANLDKAMAIRIQGPDGQHWEGAKSRSEIQGDFETDLDLSELEPHDTAQERRDLTTMLQVLTPQVAFLSPTFTKKFFRSWNWYEPQIVDEFQGIAEFLAAGGLQAVQGGGEPAGEAGGGSPARGGAKPPGQGPEQGRTTEGRSQGRALRPRGEQNTLLGPKNTPPGEAA